MKTEYYKEIKGGLLVPQESKSDGEESPTEGVTREG